MYDECSQYKAFFSSVYVRSKIWLSSTRALKTVYNVHMLCNRGDKMLSMQTLSYPRALYIYACDLSVLMLSGRWATHRRNLNSTYLVYSYIFLLAYPYIPQLNSHHIYTDMHSHIYVPLISIQHISTFDIVPISRYIFPHVYIYKNLNFLAARFRSTELANDVRGSRAPEL